MKAVRYLLTGAAAAGLALHELGSKEASLEEAFMEMTHHAVEYRGSVSADRSGKEPS